jgi:hypothetical protein
MQVEHLPAGPLLGVHGQRQLVADLAAVIGELAVGVVDAVEAPDHPGEVGLAVGEVARHHPGGPDDRAHPQVLAVDDRLGADQLPVELIERHRRRDDSVLDIE